MKKKSLFFIVLILSACTPQVTVTSEVTSTVIPLPTETQIPTPTNTLEPPIYYAEAQLFLGNDFQVNPDGKVIDKTNDKEISGLIIVEFDKETMIDTGRPSDPEPTWAWQRTYEFEGNTEFTVNGTQYDLIVTPESGLDMYAWEYSQGEFKRQKIEFNNGLKMDAYSTQETEYMLITNSSSKGEHRGDTFISVSSMIGEILTYRAGGTNYRDRFITYKGMRELMVNRWASNFITTIDNGKIIETQTSTFVVVTLEGRNRGFFIWYGVDGKPIIKAVESKYLDVPEHFDQGLKGKTFGND